MMNRMVLSLVSVAALALTAQADIVSARRAFEKEYAGPFAWTSLCLPSSVPAEEDLFRVPVNARFLLALPHAEDCRLKFAEVSVRAGKFVSGQLFVLGFKPKAIKRDEFLKLQETTPMISVRIDKSDAGAVSVLYAPKAAQSGYKVAADDDLRINPLWRLLGPLEKSTDRLRINLKNLKIPVELKGKDGREFAIGTFADNKTIEGDAVIEAVRSELERRAPERKGRVSDRDVVDYWRGSTVCYKPVAVFKGKGAGK